MRRTAEPELRQPAGAVRSSVSVDLSPAERRARRILIIGAVVVGLLLIGLIVLLVFLSLDAYQAAQTGQTIPTPGEAVVSLLRDAAIVFVAFESLLIGILLVILMLQMQALVSLLRDEIKPMLQSANETLATVRGTTQFVSHNVVTPVMKWSSYLAGVQRVLREISGLSKRDSE